MAETPRMKQLQALLADEPGDSFLRYGLAMEHMGQGDDATAAEQLRALIESDAGYVPAYLMCAQALNRLDRTDEAVAVLKRGVAEAQFANELHALGELQGLLAALE